MFEIRLGSSCMGLSILLDVLCIYCYYWYSPLFSYCRFYSCLIGTVYRVSFYVFYSCLDILQLVHVFLWFLYRGQYWEAGPPPPLVGTVLFHCPRRILEPIFGEKLKKITPPPPALSPQYCPLSIFPFSDAYLSVFCSAVLCSVICNRRKSRRDIGSWTVTQLFVLSSGICKKTICIWLYA